MTNQKMTKAEARNQMYDRIEVLNKVLRQYEVDHYGTINDYKAAKSTLEEIDRLESAISATWQFENE